MSIFGGIYLQDLLMVTQNGLRLFPDTCSRARLVTNDNSLQKGHYLYFCLSMLQVRIRYVLLMKTLTLC